MKQAIEKIESRLKVVADEIAALGPALQGAIKKNRNRRVRKDGSIYVSPEHYTFVYRGVDGAEKWKRISAKNLPAVTRMKKAGDEYKRLVREHARLMCALAIASLEKTDDKKSGPAML
jgi:hypothetical protein